MITRKILSCCFQGAIKLSQVQVSKFPMASLTSQFQNQNLRTPQTTQVRSYASENKSDNKTETSLWEFIDDKVNWVEAKVKHGRPWKLDDLRIKSNADLHQLWYVLHKERNMLLTMEEYYKENATTFPSPERLAKVDESMENIMAVVEERNVAYNLIETGESKSIITHRRYNSLGFIQAYRPKEYLVPWFLNKTWKLKYHYKRLPYWSKFYRTCYRVFLRKERGKILDRVRYAKKQIRRNHPEYYKENQELVEQHYKKEYGYKPPKPYHEMLRKPQPTDLPTRLSERIKNQ